MPSDSPSEETKEPYIPIKERTAAILKRSLDSLEFPKLRSELINLAETDPARERLNELKPSSDIFWIRDELKRINEIKGLMDRGSGFGSGGLTDIRKILDRVKIMGSVLQATDMLSVLHHLRVHHTTRKTLDREQKNMTLTFKISRPLLSLKHIENEIDKSITPEGTIRDGASKELSRIRRAIAALQIDMRKRITGIAARLAKQGFLQSESFTIRDGRYVLPIKADNFRKVKGIVHDRSSTGGTIFIEPTSVIDIGNEFRAFELAERDEIRRILRELTEKISLEAGAIEINLGVMTILDCLWAKAKLAEMLDAYPPIINPSGNIQLFKARHPLLVLADERKVVPLDLELGKDHTCLIISGPNAGGKSVALKCTGLICVMAACGLHVPALPGTEIPLFENFHAVIGDQQSISDDLSTFSAHTTRLKEILEFAKKNSLVLVDEIGSGTDPQEGSSLSIAALEQLAAKKIPTIVTTHHGVLKAFAHTMDSCANGSMAFDHGTFLPTYRFQPNLPGSSYALDIASRVGLPKQIIDRAREILGAEQTQLDDLIQSLTEKLKRYEKMVVGQERREKDYSHMEAAWTEKMDRLKTREKQIKKRMNHEVQAVVAASRREVEKLVREIRENDASKESIKAAQDGLKKIATMKDLKIPEMVIEKEEPPKKSGEDSSMKIKPRRQKPKVRTDEGFITKPLEVGDFVVIDDSRSKGEISAFSSNNDRACVVIGSIQLWINTDRLSYADPPEEKQPIRVFASVPKVPLELDLRGLDVQEAIERTDRYLSDGASTTRTELGIIHGKGKGILSAEIRKFLKTHKCVESFRFGEHGEGDYGVTVVKLKGS
ncbi:MAG: hypothetical protein HN590_07505 [Calditrichaeota bacterium]|nr:hypothetical protein [Calditrichota bacterium]